MVRSRTGSSVFYQSIAEDVKSSPNIAKKYIQILESLFIIFKVIPYSMNNARSVLKTLKVYFYSK